MYPHGLLEFGDGRQESEGKDVVRVELECDRY